MLSKVCSAFKKVIVVLNVGNIIDMKWVNEYDPSSVLYVWQGGQEGGNSLADVLIGNVTPSGKLADTIAYDISDYPSTKNFGNRVENRYCEDIYLPPKKSSIPSASVFRTPHSRSAITAYPKTAPTLTFRSLSRTREAFREKRSFRCTTEHLRASSESPKRLLQDLQRLLFSLPVRPKP